MKKEETTFQEQEAPLKNTDGAFVQVGKNGEPVIPAEEDKRNTENEPQPGSLKDR